MDRFDLKYSRLKLNDFTSEIGMNAKKSSKERLFDKILTKKTFKGRVNFDNLIDMKIALTNFESQDLEVKEFLASKLALVKEAIEYNRNH